MIPAVSAATEGGAAGLPYQWVVVGDSGQLSTSTSTTTASWTSRTSSFGATTIWGVASNGISLYVAVGESGKLATSADGITWTQQTSSFGATAIRAVAYGNGNWVATGDNGTVATSSNGTTWTQRTTGISASFNVTSVAYGNGLWVIMNTNGDMYTATDPTSTWTSRTSTLSNGGIHAVHYFKGQSIWIAGIEAGTTGALASSTDGLTWTARNSTLSPVLGNMGIASNNTVAVISVLTSLVPTVNDFQSSANGTTWTDRTPAITNIVVVNGASDDAGLLCFVGTTSQTSTDGVTWTSRAATSVSAPRQICHSSGEPSIR